MKPKGKTRYGDDSIAWTHHVPTLITAMLVVVITNLIPKTSNLKNT